MLDNYYNVRTLTKDSKDLMNKAEVDYNNLKDRVKFNVKSKI